MVMKRGAFYSGRRSPSSDRDGGPASGSSASGPTRTAGPPGRSEHRPGAGADAMGSQRASIRSRSIAWLKRQRTGVAFFAGIVLTLAIVLGRDMLRPAPPPLTQDDIDAAVLHTFETKVLPSRAVRPAMAIAPSVVRIQAMSLDKDQPGAELQESGVGTGVVVMEDGTLLTNLHVVAGADELKVTFFDGTESAAQVAGTKPENDLAILKPQKIPDDLAPATLGSSRGLMPGDDVVVVGFPFGIGPSVSAGVVSGLNRQFRSRDGEPALKGLIQFDAAANPGNSGGPLVNASGEVVGIVTAILNPTSARTFVGIGFAVTIEDAGNALGVPPF
jgi:S1-C subfamily serine protease